MALLRAPVLLLAASQFVPQPASAQALRPAEVRGCYDLRFGDWSPPPPQPLDTLRYLPPPRVEFDTVPAFPDGPGPSSFVANPAPGSRASRHRFHGWRVEGDSIFAGWSTGFVGVRLRLGQVGDGFRGYAKTFSDAYGPGDRDHRAEVDAIRVPCSKAPDFPAAESEFVIRSVNLALGQIIQLGEPIPDSALIESQRNTRTFVLRGPAAGVFSQASEIRVEESRSGVLREINLFFPEGTDPESINELLEQAMGKEGHRSSRMSMFFAHWEDVSTSLSLAVVDGRVQILIFDPRLL